MNVETGRHRISIVYVILLLCAVALGPCVFGMATLSVGFGSNIVSFEIKRDYLFAVVWAGILGLTILVWPIPVRHKADLLVLWTVKCLVTLSFMLVYEQFLWGDGPAYYAKAAPWYTVTSFQFGRGTENIVYLTWLHSQVFPYAFHLIKVSYSMVGLIGIYVWYHAITLYLGRDDRRLLYIIGLYPSIIFWSSILGKDPITLLALGLFSLAVIGWYRTRRARYLVVGLIGLIIAMYIRSWLGPILILPTFILMFRFTENRSQRFLLSLVVAVGLFVTMHLLLNQMRVATLQDVLDQANGASHGMEMGGSAGEVGDLSSPVGLLLFLPRGAFTALFCPLPGQVLNGFGILAGLENMYLLSLLFHTVRRSRWSDLREPLLCWCVMLLVTWGIFYGMLSTANLGSGARFKLQILPLLIFTLRYMARQRVVDGGNYDNRIPSEPETPNGDHTDSN